jgi:HSP20 family protein
MVSRFFRSGDPFSQLHREVNRVFDEVVRTIPALRGGFSPDIDLHETPTGLELTAELPGLAEDDIELRLEGATLLLSGEKKSVRQSDQASILLTERGWGRFERTVRLPFAPDEALVEARFEHGILHVAIPRPGEPRGPGRIRINAGSAAAYAAGTTAAATDYTSHAGDPPVAAQDAPKGTPKQGSGVEPATGHATLTAAGGDSTGTSSGAQVPIPVPQGGATQGGVPTSHSDQAPGTRSRPSRDKVDEASRDSFPASDAPANSGITGTIKSD